MADDQSKIPGSITQNADMRSEHISEISNINKTISNMQKQINQQLTEIDKDMGDSDAISEVQNSMVKVLNKMSMTVGQIGKGFSRVATDTAKSGRDMVSEYSKAIHQDINYNKQNMVAMALSRTSPIFGYFVSKFMETDVWKSATERMKANIGNALSSAGQKFKSAVSGITFGRKAKTEDSAIKGKKSSEKIPHMAKGGVVEKGGLARLHAAEVVMPVEKLLSRIDDQIDVTKTLAETIEKGQIKSIAKMSTYVGSADKRQEKNTFKAYMKAMHEVHSQYEEPSEKRMLRALLAIQDALGAQLGTWQQVWQKMIITNPFFRNAMITGNIMRKIFAAPFKPAYAFFKGRGGYEGHLSNSSQPLEAVSENIGVLYTGSMHRMDRITMYTRATAEATRDLSSYITGNAYKEIEGIKTGRWSFFKGARGLVNWMTKMSVKGFGRVSQFGLPKEQRQAQVKYFDDLAEALTKKRGVFWENWGFGGQQKKLRGGLGAAGFETPEEKAIGAMTKVFSNKKLLSYIEKQGALPVSDKKVLKITDQNWRENKQANEREKRRSIFGFLSGGFGAVKSLLGGATNFLGSLFGGGGLGSMLKGGLAGLLTSGLTGALGSSAVTGALASSLGPALGVAAAGFIGWKIGKQVDEMLGISASVNKKLAEWGARSRELNEKVNKDMMASVKAARKGGREGYAGSRSVGLTAGLETGGIYDRNIGWGGQTHVSEISAAQREFMQAHVNEYLPYHPDVIREMRNKWEKSGLFMKKGMFMSPQKYGHKREQAFLNYLKGRATPMSEKEASEHYSQYKKQFGLMTQAKNAASDFYGTVKEKVGGATLRVTDIAKNEIRELSISGDLMRKELVAATQKNLSGMKEMKDDFVGAAHQQTVVISNSIQNAASTTIQAGKNAANYAQDQYQIFGSHGDVDGD